MYDSISDAPRSLPTRDLISVHVTPRELYRLIRLLEADAVQAAEDVDQEDFADYLVQRAATLREAVR
jgi:hypothetical protein